MLEIHFSKITFCYLSRSKMMLNALTKSKMSGNLCGVVTLLSNSFSRVLLCRISSMIRFTWSRRMTLKSVIDVEMCTTTKASRFSSNKMELGWAQPPQQAKKNLASITATNCWWCSLLDLLGWVHFFRQTLVDFGELKVVQRVVGQNVSRN